MRYRQFKGGLAVGFAVHRDLSPFLGEVKHYDRVIEATLGAWYDDKACRG